MDRSTGRSERADGKGGPATDGAPESAPSDARWLGGRILERFDRRRRRLPWRGESDPYRILVSEVMLQQTRVETVLRYYGPWMDRFPDLGALADAPPDEVLLAWEGLGYYSRARRLQEAARAVRDRHGGVIPRDPTALRSLPGVGEYTAAAVASIAYGVRAATVDGNVKRVLSRLYDLPRPARATLRRLASGLLDPERPGDSNQALMELGATVCTPRAPRCGDCPVASRCRALAAGTVSRRPEPAGRRPIPERRYALAVLARPDDAKVLLARRGGSGLLAGLWAFPESVLAGEGEEDTAEDGAGAGAEAGQNAAPHASPNAVPSASPHAGPSAGPNADPTTEDAARHAAALARALGFAVDAGRPLPRVAHAFTHLRALYLPVLFLVEGRPRAPRGARWVPWAGPRGVALPTAQRRVLSEAARVLGETDIEGVRAEAARPASPHHGSARDPDAP